jgi:hypothetical protein
MGSSHLAVLEYERGGEVGPYLLWPGLRQVRPHSLQAVWDRAVLNTGTSPTGQLE